jgi:hypothetical protein
VPEIETWRRVYRLRGPDFANVYRAGASVSVGVYSCGGLRVCCPEPRAGAVVKHLSDRATCTRTRTREREDVRKAVVALDLDSF